MVRTVAQRQLVVSACAMAAAKGVTSDMPLSDARALLRGSPAIAEHDPHRQAQSLRAIAVWGHRFSPLVAVDATAGLLLDITGCSHLFGGEPSMLTAVEAAFDRLGLDSRIAIAPTFGAARALARFGARRAIVGANGLRASLEPLPLESLIAEPDVVAGMAEVGVTRIGGMLALPRASIADRFGDAVLHRVDQALGYLPEVIEPVRPAAPPCVARVFEGPCSCLDAIGLACRGLLERLCEELSRLARGATECRVTLDRCDMEPLHIDLRLSAASRDPAHLWSLFRPRLERAHLGFGIDGIAIAARRFGLIRQEQRRWWATAEPAASPGAGLDQLLDTLVNRLGHANVMRAIPVESHIPERARRMASVLDPAPASTAGVTDADRPSVLFSEPIPGDVIALTPAGPVSRFTINGKGHGVRACLGPERIASEWWREARFTRDYFKVQDDSGRWVWLFQDLDSRAWFFQGVWA